MSNQKPRGFAAMDRKQVSEIARKGGKAAHAAGTAHEFTSEEARAAGSKGGKATHSRRRGVHAARPATVSGTANTGNDNDGKVVDVMCSSAAGCAGTVKAGTPEAAEAIGKPYTPGTKGAPKGDSGPSADEDPDNMGSCGSSGCGSHG